MQLYTHPWGEISCDTQKVSGADLENPIFPTLHF